MFLYTQPLSSLDWGDAYTSSTLSYAFAAPDTITTSDEAFTLGDSFGAEGFVAYEKAQFRKAFDLIEAVTNLTFVETPSYGAADIRMLLDTNQFYFTDLGVAAPVGEPGGGAVAFNGSYWDRFEGGDLELGGYSFTTITHELLHVLGLAHPHDRGGSSTRMSGVFDAFDDFGWYDLNQGVYTTMTYNNGLFTGTVGAHSTAYYYGFEAGPMALDIAVLQAKYGVNTSHAAGDDTYRLPDFNESGTYWSAIWDAGGTDEIVYDGTRNVTIDLRAATLENDFGGGGYLSAAKGILGGFSIANGAVIEQATGDAGADRLIGNDADNILTGKTGRDRLEGGGGNDLLDGGDDPDQIFGDGGDDTLEGGAGDDTLKGNSGADALLGGAGDDVILSGSDADEAKGGQGNDLIRGNLGRDALLGGRGDDTLEGGASADTLTGGQGNDALYGGKGTDLLMNQQGDGILFGNNGDDHIEAGGGDDSLSGGNGDDTLIAGSGNDTLKGGQGYDVFVFEEGFDRAWIEDLVQRDTLLLGSDLLGGQTTGAQVVAQFGTQQSSGNYVLDFGRGDWLVLEGIGDETLVADVIEIF